MNIPRHTARLGGLFAAGGALFTAGVALAGLALAQEKSKDEKGKEGETKEPKLELPDLSGVQGEQREMVQLFHEVERTLQSIDVELFDAGAGRIPAPEGKDSGIERLLRSNGEKSDQAVVGIERILEIAQQMNGQSGGT